MIQRLQSVYLLLAAALVVTSMFMPMATIVTPEDPWFFGDGGIIRRGPFEIIIYNVAADHRVGIVCLVGLDKYFPVS